MNRAILVVRCLLEKVLKFQMARLFVQYNATYNNENAPPDAALQFP